MKRNNDYNGPEELHDNEVSQEPANLNSEESENAESSIEDNLSAEPTAGGVKRKLNELNDSYLRLHAESIIFAADNEGEGRHH